MASYTDPFMRLIELMAQALGVALNKLLGLKQEGKVGEAIEQTNHYLKTELKTNINELSKIKNEQLIIFLKTKNIHQQHLENFAILLVEYADILTNKEEKQNLLEKSFTIFSHLNKQDKTFSIERQNYMNRINLILKSE